MEDDESLKRAGIGHQGRSLGTTLMGSNRRRWTKFCSTLTLWLTATQLALLLLDIECDLDNNDNEARHTQRRL